MFYNIMLFFNSNRGSGVIQFRLNAHSCRVDCVSVDNDVDNYTVEIGINYTFVLRRD